MLANLLYFAKFLLLSLYEQTTNTLEILPDDLKKSIYIAVLFCPFPL
jgi:hypothetical protein